jgi:hypothetical protein
MKNICLPILFCVLFGVAGCAQDDPHSPDVPLTPEQQVLENCRRVKAAAEQFAKLTDGNYPADRTDLTPGGLTLVDLLPGGELLENPYTGLKTSPVNGGANSPGDVGYIGFLCELKISSYAITGVGELEGDRFVTIRRTCGGEPVELTRGGTPDLDDRVLENCFVVQVAAEAYAAGNDGVYATDRTTPNLEGNTIVDLLPGRGYLVNPSTGDTTEPSGECGGLTGATGYAEFEEYDHALDQFVQTGYYISGKGTGSVLW